MPDFERVLRSLELHLAKDETAKQIVSARHQGENKARKEIVVVVLIIAGLILLGTVLFHGHPPTP